MQPSKADQTFHNREIYFLDPKKKKTLIRLGATIVGMSLFVVAAGFGKVPGVNQILVRNWGEALAVYGTALFGLLIGVWFLLESKAYIEIRPGEIKLQNALGPRTFALNLLSSYHIQSLSSEGKAVTVAVLMGKDGKVKGRIPLRYENDDLWLGWLDKQLKK